MFRSDATKILPDTSLRRCNACDSTVVRCGSLHASAKPLEPSKIRLCSSPTWSWEGIRSATRCNGVRTALPSYTLKGLSKHSHLYGKYKSVLVFVFIIRNKCEYVPLLMGTLQIYIYLLLICYWVARPNNKPIINRCAVYAIRYCLYLIYAIM